MPRNPYSQECLLVAAKCRNYRYEAAKARASGDLERALSLELLANQGDELAKAHYARLRNERAYRDKGLAELIAESQKPTPPPPKLTLDKNLNGYGHKAYGNIQIDT